MKTSLRLSEETRRQLKVLAAARGVSQGELVAMLLENASSPERLDDDLRRMAKQFFFRGYSLPMGAVR